ncbi:acyltransferase 3 [Dactylonectria macrodidyma]|uniref:Acyltransferase 3 n=1 Tax=Dactylonectria macrodidyma TaxID=307937 RepID=A0A9P9ERJ8_9HYPO|nr:acyltransferase 3 [Dactylonectria macrodidyma]
MAPAKSVVPPGRKYWLDNLRGVMTTIVILNHTAAAYGGGGTHPNPAGFTKTSPILLPYVAFHYAYGLGQFFWLSGNLTAKSLSKGSWREFATSKLLRLGLPALLYSVFLEPLQAIALRPRLQGGLRSNLKDYWKAVRDFKGWLTPGAGTVWYTMTLLIFDLCALVLQRCLRLFSNGRAKSSEFSKLAKFYGQLCRWGWLVVAASRFLVSTRFPFGYELPVVNVQPYYLPQHIYGYVLGFMASYLGKPRMSSLYDKQSGPLGKLSMAKASAISLAALPIVFLPGWLRSKRANKKSDNTKEKDTKDTDSPPTDIERGLQLSGWTSDAALFALWNEFTFNTVGPAFMSLWERNYNQPGKQRLWSPRYAYAAYLLHSPISWFVGQSLHTLMCRGGERPAWMDSETWQNLGPLVMTTTAGYIEVAASFGAGLLLIDYVPGAGAII